MPVFLRSNPAPHSVTTALGCPLGPWVVCFMLVIAACGRGNAGHDAPVASGLPLGQTAAWQRHVMTFQDNRLGLLVREHKPGVTLKDALAKAPESHGTAFGVWAELLCRGLAVQQRSDLAAMSQLFDAPQHAMQGYQTVEKEVGGWAAYVRMLRDSTRKTIDETVVVAELAVDGQHVFVLDRPATATTYRVVREVPDGRFVHVTQWSPVISHLLTDDAILQYLPDLNIPE